VLRFENFFLLANLLLIPIMVIAFRLLLRWKSTTRLRIGDPGLVDQLTRAYSPSKFRIKFLLVITAFALTVIGLANLQSPREVENVQGQGVDVMVALDVSRSMMAKDIQPNRLERAKQFINRLIDRLGNDRFGLVVFAGRAYMQMPLTTDHAAAKIYVNAANTESVPTQGTVIGEALSLCNDAFIKKEMKYKAVVLLSDGEDHDEGAMGVVKKMRDAGVILQTIGVGSTEGDRIMDPVTQQPRTDSKGNIILTRLNERELMSLAQEGNGQYILLTDTYDAVERITSRIKAMEQKSIIDESSIHYRSFFSWFLAVALILLVSEFLIPETHHLVA
jgi:Ca-activated chloride channel family protein